MCGTVGLIAGDLRAGVRAIAGIRPLRAATVASVISCAGQGALLACAPLLGERVFGEAGHGATLLSGIAVSALGANALLARRPRSPRPDTIVWAGTILQAVACLLAAVPRPATLIVAVLIAGIGEGPQLTALFAVRHREAPERLRGQVFTTGASLKITGFAVGAGVAGPIATWSLPGALLAAAAIHLMAALSFALCARPSHPG